MTEKISQTWRAWRKGYQQGIKEEREAWLQRKRCSICGESMKPKPTSDICDNCYENE